MHNQHRIITAEIGGIMHVTACHHAHFPVRPISFKIKADRKLMLSANMDTRIVNRIASFRGASNIINIKNNTINMSIPTSNITSNSNGIK